MSNEDFQEIDIELHEKQAKKLIRQRRVRGKQTHLKHIHTLCRFLLSSFLLVGCYYFLKLPGWYIPQDAFTNSDSDVIKIYNNNIVPAEKIYKMLSGYEVSGYPIFAEKSEEIKKLVMDLPPIKDVYVRRYAFPARLDLIVKERVPVLTISPDVGVEPVAYFTQDGIFVGKEYAKYINTAQTLLILSYGNKGQDYHNWDKTKTDEFMDFAKYIEILTKEKVEYIDYRNPEDVFVKIPSVTIRIGKIDKNAYDCIKKLPSILPEIKLMDEKIKYLDLRWKDPYLKLAE